MVSCLSHILQYSSPPPPSAGSLDKPSTSPVLCCEAEPPSISSYLHFKMTIYLQPIIPHCKCLVTVLSASCCRQRGMIYIYQFITSHVSTTLTVVWESGQWQHFKSLSLHNGGLSNQFIYLIIGPLLNNKLIIYRGHEIEFSQFYVQNFKAVPVLGISK